MEKSSHKNSLLTPDDLAAYDHVDRMVTKADDMSCGVPSWHGWALRESFLAGIKHERGKKEKHHKNHELKISLNWLYKKLAGDKLFEIRGNDRDFKVGDTVSYRETLLGKDWRIHTFEITCIVGYMQKHNYVVFGEKFIKSEQSALKTKG